MNPDFSIIIPVYNLGSQIGGAIESCLAQGLPADELEIIAVNDGSTDNSADVLEHYRQQHPQLRVLTQENQGVSAARNSGVDASKGNYITFLDADDRLAPGTLSKNAKLLHSHPEIACLLFPLVRTNEDLKEIDLTDSALLASCKYREVEKLSAADAMLRCLERKIPPIACSGLFSRELLLRHPFQQGRFEDSRFFYALLKNHVDVLLSPYGAYQYIDMQDSFIHAPWDAGKWSMYVHCCLEKYETCLALLPEQSATFINERSSLYYTLVYLKRKNRKEPSYGQPLEIYLKHLPKPDFNLKQELKLLFKTAYTYLHSLT